MTNEELKPSIKLVVKKPMRVNAISNFVPDIIPSLEITPDESIKKKLTKAMYDYQYKYRDKPSHFLLTPEEYLSFVADLRCAMHNFAGTSLCEEVKFYDIPVLPCIDNVGINLNNLSHIVWDRTEQKPKP